MPIRPETRLDSNPFGKPSFVFPNNLGEVSEEPFTIFQVRETLTGATPEGGPRNLGTIALPIPRDLKAGYAAGYETVSLDINDLIEKFSGGGGFFNRTNVERIGGNIANSITQANADKAVDLFQGQIINPHMAALFQGMDFRSFSFDYSLIAKNAQESESIRQIINVFKFHMHPKISEDVQKRRFLIMPQNFVISFFSPRTEFLFRISLCVLEDCQVTYNGSGVPAFFNGTGAPVDIRLSLRFKEIEIMHQDRIKQGF